MTDTVPEGFSSHARASPLTEPWQPLFSKTFPDRVQIGLHLARPHTNSRGLMHGGLVATLADNAMGLSCLVQLNENRGGRAPVTVNLAVDYFGKASIGQWILFDTKFISVGNTLSFAQCFVSADGTTVARANATFRI